MVNPSLAGGEVARAVASMAAGPGPASSSPPQQHIQQPTKPSVAHAVVQKKRGVFPSLLKKTKHNKAGAARLVPFSKKTLQPPIVKIDVIKPNSSDETKISSLTDHDGVISRLEHEAFNVLVAQSTDKGPPANAAGSSRKQSHLPPRKTSHEIFSDQSVGPPPEEPSNKKVLELNNGFKLAAPSPMTVDRVAVQGASENSSYAANSQRKKKGTMQQQQPNPAMRNTSAVASSSRKKQELSMNVVSKLPSPRDATPNMSPGGGQISPDSNRKVLSPPVSPRPAGTDHSLDETTTVELLNPLEGQVPPAAFARRDPPHHQATSLSHLPPSPVVKPRETKAVPPPVPNSAMSTSANNHGRKIAFEKVKELLNRVNGRANSKNNASLVGCPSNLVQTMQSMYSHEHDSSGVNSTLSTNHTSMGPHLAAATGLSSTKDASGRGSARSGALGPVSTSMEPPGSTSTAARSVQLPHPQDYRQFEINTPERRSMETSLEIERVESIPVVPSSGSMVQTFAGGIVRVSGSLRGSVDPNGAHSVTDALVLPHSASLDHRHIDRARYGSSSDVADSLVEGNFHRSDNQRSVVEQRLRDTIAEAKMVSNGDLLGQLSYEEDTDKTNAGLKLDQRPSSSGGTMYTSSYSLVQALRSSPRHLGSTTPSSLQSNLSNQDIPRVPTSDLALVEEILSADGSVNGEEILGFALPSSSGMKPNPTSTVFHPVAHPMPVETGAARHPASFVSESRVPIDAPEAPPLRAEPPEDTAWHNRSVVESPCSLKSVLDESLNAIESPSSEVDRMLNLFFTSIRSESQSPHKSLTTPDSRAGRAHEDTSQGNEAAALYENRTQSPPLSRVDSSGSRRRGTEKDKVDEYQPAIYEDAREELRSRKTSEDWASVSVRQISHSRSIASGVPGRDVAHQLHKDDEAANRGEQSMKLRSSEFDASRSIESVDSSIVVHPIATSRAGIELPRQDNLQSRASLTETKEVLRSDTNRHSTELVQPSMSRSLECMNNEDDVVSPSLLAKEPISVGNSPAALTNESELQENELSATKRAISSKENPSCAKSQPAQNVIRGEQPVPVEERKRVASEVKSDSPIFSYQLLDQSATKPPKKRVTMKGQASTTADVRAGGSSSNAVRHDALVVGDPCGLISDSLNNVAAVGISGLGDAGLTAVPPAPSSMAQGAPSKSDECKDIAESSFLSSIGRSWGRALNPIFGVAALTPGDDTPVLQAVAAKDINGCQDAKEKSSQQQSRAMETVPMVGNYRSKVRNESDADELQIEVRLAPSELMSFEESSFARESELKLSESQRADDASPIYYLSGDGKKEDSGPVVTSALEKTAVIGNGSKIVQTNVLLDDSDRDSDHPRGAPAVDTDAVLAALESSLPLTKGDERQIKMIQSPSNAKRPTPRKKKGRNPKKAVKTMKSPSSPSETNKAKLGRTQQAAVASLKHPFEPVAGSDGMGLENQNTSLPKEIALAADDPVSDLDQSIRHFPMKQIFAGGSVDVSGLGHSRDDLSEASKHEDELDKYAPLVTSSRHLNQGDLKGGPRALADSLSGTEKPAHELHVEWADEKTNNKSSGPPVASKEFSSGCLPTVFTDFGVTFCQQLMLTDEEQGVTESRGRLVEEDKRMGLEPKEGYKRSMQDSGHLVTSVDIHQPTSNPQDYPPSHDSTAESLDCRDPFEPEAAVDPIIQRSRKDPLGVEPLSSHEWKNRSDPPTREKFIKYEAADSIAKMLPDLVPSDNALLGSGSTTDIDCESAGFDADAQSGANNLIHTTREASAPMREQRFLPSIKQQKLNQQQRPEPMEQKEDAVGCESLSKTGSKTSPPILSGLNLDDDSVSCERHGLPALLSTIHEEDSEGIAETVTGSVGRLSQEENHRSSDGAHTLVNRILQFGQDALGLSPRSKEELETRMQDLSPTSKRVLEKSIKQARVETSASPHSDIIDVIDLTGVNEDDLFKQQEEDDAVWIFDLTKQTDEEDSFKDLDELLGFAAARLGLPNDPQGKSQFSDVEIANESSIGGSEMVVIVEGTQDSSHVFVKGRGARAAEDNVEEERPHTTSRRGKDRYSVTEGSELGVKMSSIRDRYAVDVRVSSQPDKLEDNDTDSLLSTFGELNDGDRCEGYSPNNGARLTEDVLCGSEEFEVVHRAKSTHERVAEEVLSCPLPHLSLGIETGNENRISDDFASRMSSLTRMSSKTLDHGPLAPKIDVSGNRVFNFVFTGDEDTHHEEEGQIGTGIQAIPRRGVRPEDMRFVQSGSRQRPFSSYSRNLLEDTPLVEPESENSGIPRTLNFKRRDVDNSSAEAPELCIRSHDGEASASGLVVADNTYVTFGEGVNVGVEIVNAQSGVEFFDFLCEGPLVVCGGDEVPTSLRHSVTSNAMLQNKASQGRPLDEGFRTAENLVRKENKTISPTVSFEVEVPQASKKTLNNLLSKQSNRPTLHEQVDVLLNPSGTLESGAEVKDRSRVETTTMSQGTQPPADTNEQDDQDFVDSLFGGAESLLCPSPHGTDVAEIGETLGNLEEASVSSIEKCETMVSEPGKTIVKRRFEAPRPEEPLCQNVIADPVCNRKQGPKPETSGLVLQRKISKPNPEFVSSAQRHSQESQKKVYLHRKGPTPEENLSAELLGRRAEFDRGYREGPLPEQNRIVLSGVPVVRGFDVSRSRLLENQEVEGEQVDYGGEIPRGDLTFGRPFNCLGNDDDARLGSSLGSTGSDNGRASLSPSRDPIVVAGVDANVVAPYASAMLERVPGIYVVSGIDLGGETTSDIVRQDDRIVRGEDASAMFTICSPSVLASRLRLGEPFLESRASNEAYGCLQSASTAISDLLSRHSDDQSTADEIAISAKITSATKGNRRSLPQSGAVVICPSSTKGIEVFDGGPIDKAKSTESRHKSVFQCEERRNTSEDEVDARQDSQPIEDEEPINSFDNLASSHSELSLGGTARVSEAETRKATNLSPSSRKLTPVTKTPEAHSEQYESDGGTSQDTDSRKETDENKTWKTRQKLTEAPSEQYESDGGTSRDTDYRKETEENTAAVCGANSSDGWNSFFCGSNNGTETRRISDSRVNDLDVRLAGIPDEDQLSPRTELKRLGKNASDNASCGDDSAVVASFLETARVIGWGLRSWRGDAENLQGDKVVHPTDNLLLEANSSSFSQDLKPHSKSMDSKEIPPGEESSWSEEDGKDPRTSKNGLDQQKVTETHVGTDEIEARGGPTTESQGRSLEPTPLAEDKASSPSVPLEIDVADTGKIEKPPKPVGIDRIAEGNLRTKSPRVHSFGEDSDDDESGLLLALTRSEGDPPILIESEASSEYSENQNETSERKTLEKAESGGIPSAVIVKEGGPRKEFTRSPKLQKVLERLRSRKRNFGSDQSVSSADVDPVDVDELFSRYDNIVKHMVVFDNDRLQRAQGGQLSSIGDASIAGEQGERTGMPRQNEAWTALDEGSQSPNVIDVTDMKIQSMGHQNKGRSVSQPKLRDPNPIRPSTSFGSEASTPSQKARDLRKQLDQALKTSAAIRTTQERLGAELSNFKSKFQKQRESISPARSRGSPQRSFRLSPPARASAASTSEAPSMHFPSPTATEQTVVSGENPLDHARNVSTDVPSEIHRPAMAMTGNVVTTTRTAPAISTRLSTISPTFEQAVNAFDKIVSDQRLKSISTRIPQNDTVDEQRQPESPSSSRPTGVTSISSPTSTRQSSERSPTTTEYESSPTNIDANTRRYQLAHVASRKKKASSPASISEETPFSSSTRRSVSEMSPIYYTIREPSKSPAKRKAAPNLDKLATLMDDDLSSDEEEFFSSSGEYSNESKEGYPGTSAFNSHDDYYDDSFSDDDAVKMQQLESIINGLRSAEERQQQTKVTPTSKSKLKKVAAHSKANKNKSKKKK